MYQLGFLGMGKMGSSILRGVLSEGVVRPGDVAFYAPSQQTQNQYTAQGLRLAKNEQDLLEISNLIILAIKPQKYDEILKNVQDLDFTGKTVVSLAPGKSIAYLKRLLPGAKVVRAMPNTPALITEAVTTIAFDGEPVEEVLHIFSTIGTYAIVKEKQIDEAIPLQGSMPAYLFEFAKTFVEEGASYGIEYEEAKKLALNSIIGSCLLALRSEDDFDTLINNVCSKGGSTIAGLNRLRERGFAEAIKECYEACVARSIELGNV